LLTFFIRGIFLTGAKVRILLSKYFIIGKMVVFQFDQNTSFIC
jgi:hypothetical protein